MQSPYTACVGGADGASEEDIEGREVSSVFRFGRKQVIGREASRMQRAVVGGETAQGL